MVIFLYFWCIFFIFFVGVFNFQICFSVFVCVFKVIFLCFWCCWFYLVWVFLWIELVCFILLSCFRVIDEVLFLTIFNCRFNLGSFEDILILMITVIQPIPEWLLRPTGLMKNYDRNLWASIATILCRENWSWPTIPPHVWKRIENVCPKRDMVLEFLFFNSQVHGNLIWMFECGSWIACSRFPWNGATSLS